MEGVFIQGDIDMEQDENGDGRGSPMPIVPPFRLSDDERESSSESNSYHTDGSSLDDESECDQDENRPPLIIRTTPVQIPSSTALKITVKKLHVTAEWKWKQGKDEDCGICRMAFESCCVNCVYPGDGCPLVTGACRHSFHQHCITKWTESQGAPRAQCPLCRQEWKEA